MLQLAEIKAFTILPKIDKVLPKSFRILPKSSKLVSEPFKVLPNLNKTSPSEQNGNSGDEMHIRKIYESFAVLEDLLIFHRQVLRQMKKLYPPLICMMMQSLQTWT